MSDHMKKLDLALHGGGLAVVLSSIGVAWSLAYQPLEAARADAEARCHEINELLLSADRLRREQSQLKRSLADAHEQEQRLLARVPDEEHEADFLRQISRLAKEVGMELRDYRPGQRQSQPTCSAMEVALTCEGHYESLCRFLDGVGRLPRLVNLSHIEIDSSHGDGVYVANLKLVIYFGAAANAVVRQFTPERKAPHA
jgi:Tfp pilus assembly protein PilO